MQAIIFIIFIIYFPPSPGTSLLREVEGREVINRKNALHRLQDVGCSSIPRLGLVGEEAT